MPKVGVKQSQKRRATTAARKAKPKARPRVKAAPKSPLAEYLADPTAAKKAKLMAQAQSGKVGPADIQAAIAQELSELVGLADREPREINALRPLYVLRHRLLKDLQEVILRTAAQKADFSDSAIWQVKVVLRGSGGDIGDQVRTVAPPESEWPT